MVRTDKHNESQLKMIVFVVLLKILYDSVN